MKKISDLINLENKVALITGGSRGLGFQFAEALGELGAKVVITARKDMNSPMLKINYLS